MIGIEIEDIAVEIRQLLIVAGLLQDIIKNHLIFPFAKFHRIGFGFFALRRIKCDTLSIFVGLCAEVVPLDGTAAQEAQKSYYKETESLI